MTDPDILGTRLARILLYLQQMQVLYSHLITKVKISDENI